MEKFNLKQEFIYYLGSGGSGALVVVVVVVHLLNVYGCVARKGMSGPKPLESTLKHPTISSANKFSC
jgi:hypothetical protein